MTLALTTKAKTTEPYPLGKPCNCQSESNYIVFPLRFVTINLLKLAKNIEKSTELFQYGVTDVQVRLLWREVKRILIYEM